MCLTVEELNNPRYKLIANYPGSRLEVDEIVSYSENHCYKIDGLIFHESILKKHPHLFQKLEWWEDRKEEEMPIFLKKTGYVNSANEPVSDIFIEVYQHFRSGSGNWRHNSYLIFIPKGDIKGTLSYSGFEPATQEEFENYNNSLALQSGR